MQADIRKTAASEPHGRPHPPPGVSPVDFGKSLQLTRASTMALTRLQLALTRADKHQARVAMDCLLDIDAELEGFVSDLAMPQGLDDPDWQSISEHLKALKTAIAFEKLVLAGEIAGPDLTAAPAVPSLAPSAQRQAADWPLAQAEAANDAPSEYKAIRLERWMPAALAVVAALMIGGLFLTAYALL